MLILRRKKVRKVEMLIKKKKFVEKIGSGKINNMKSAKEWYLKNIYLDKKVLQAKKC